MKKVMLYMATLALVGWVTVSCSSSKSDDYEPPREEESINSMATDSLDASQNTREIQN
nr:hypothetical protein [Allomuricauda sp.]